jgi:hypothetical protein
VTLLARDLDLDPCALREGETRARDRLGQAFGEGFLNR